MRDRRAWFDLHDDTLSAPDVAILGLPYDGGATLRAGAARAPAKLREISRTSDPITRRGRPIEGIRLRDFGDVPAPEASVRQTPQRDYLDAVEAKLDALPGARLVLAVGGDNSVTIPCLSSFAKRHGRDAGVIWFDAHPDLFESYDGVPESHACALRPAPCAGA